MNREAIVSEDVVSVLIGLFVFALASAMLVQWDVLGWAVNTSVWMHIGKALAPISSHYARVPGAAAMAATFAFMLIVVTAGIALVRVQITKFIAGFTFVFAFSYACWIAGSWAYLAATPDKLKTFGITRSLNLTSEGGFIVALLLGLLIGNFFPAITAKFRDGIRPELYIKTAIVILGGFLGITALEQLRLATSVMLRGLCAIVEAYLIYWAVVYWVARRYFHFPREWAAPLASGISICGVSAAIATGSAIRARPIVPVMVSSLVVIFAVIELLVLPFVAAALLGHQPLVAGAWMGLAVKTDGAAVASGAVTEALIRAKALGAGVAYTPGWIVGVTTTVKVFIDVFIGIWAFLLAWIWTSKINPKAGEKVRLAEVWERCPKFIFGYLLTFALVLATGALAPKLVPNLKAAMVEANVFRGIFFVMTFFSIGLVTNFRKLWEEGIGRLAAVYVVCLFGFIIWFSLIISWIFFGGVLPPAVRG